MAVCVTMLRQYGFRFLNVKIINDMKQTYSLCCIPNQPQGSSSVIISCYYPNNISNGLGRKAERSVCNIQKNITRLQSLMQVVFFCDSSDKNRFFAEEDMKKNIGVISEKFTESISLVEDAKNSLGTVYFSEDMKDAEDKVDETLNSYNALLKQLSDSQKAEVNRTVGLKMNELKAQLDMIREMCRE